MFTMRCSHAIMIILVYVDDIIITALTGSSSNLLTEFLARLHTVFQLKDLGDLHYFLGIHVSPFNNGLHLSQLYS